MKQPKKKKVIIIIIVTVVSIIYSLVFFCFFSGGFGILSVSNVSFKIIVSTQLNNKT